MSRVEIPEESSKKGHFEMDSKTAYKTVGLIHDSRGSSHVVVSDEPEPHGTDEAVSPVSYLFLSLVSCQMVVLTACLQKARIEDFVIKADAALVFREDDHPEEMPEFTAQRVDDILIDLTLEVPEEHARRAERCLEVYDDGCLVGQSLKAGISYATENTLVTK